MRLGGPAKHLVTVHDKHELASAIDWAEKERLSYKAIGGGSNIVWGDKGFDGLIIVNAIAGFRVQNESKEISYVTVGAGEDWDSVVQRTVDAGLHGIEALSLIPGTAGATPVQNVGAYGQEIAQTLVGVEVFDTKTHQFITIPADKCSFGYRTSRFKTKDRGRFIIVQLTFQLRHINPRPPYYPAVAQYLRTQGTRVVTPKTLREAVIAIRTKKLPDPKKVANNGSFFANPIVSQSFFAGLQKAYPEIPHWAMPDNRVKISAAWLIEQAGYRDKHDPKTGMATWPQQPLVLVNRSASSTADLLAFRNAIIHDVERKFDITLEQEPELVR